jgi:hypothetical protein
MQQKQHRMRLSEIDRETVQKILLLRRQGASYRRIATAVSLSHGSVMRILKWQNTGEEPKTAKANIPKRPRNGQRALPDFELVSQFEAKGLTVKGAWRDYVKTCSRPYAYPHFSTLYRVWLEGQTKRRNGDHVATDAVLGSAAPPHISDFSAEEDRLAELYWKRRVNPRSAVHVLSGFNCSLKVRSDELVAFDTGEDRLFSKVTHGLRSIVFLGEGGNITLDAIKWCEAQGVAICVLGWHGNLISITTPHAISDVTIRRAQFAANRLTVAQAILTRKIQSEVAIGRFPAASGLDLGQRRSYKGHDRIIAALPGVIARVPDAVYLIVGSAAAIAGLRRVPLWVQVHGVGRRTPRDQPHPPHVPGAQAEAGRLRIGAGHARAHHPTFTARARRRGWVERGIGRGSYLNRALSIMSECERIFFAHLHCDELRRRFKRRRPPTRVVPPVPPEVIEQAILWTVLAAPALVCSCDI